MDIAALFQIALYQLLTARDAPLPVVLAIVVTALIVWWLTRWRTRSVVQSLKRALVRRDAELDKLRAHGTVAAEMSEDAPQGADERRAPSVDRRKALQPIVNAIDEAAQALRTDDPRDVDRAMTSMTLALQGVNRQFGLPVPTIGVSARETLTTGKRYLEEIRPPLRAGQDDEAHGAAVAFLSR